MSDPTSRIRELEEAVRLLTLENDSLAERAEDTLLLGLIAEKIGTTTDPDLVLEVGLEQIALLKDIPFCACGRLSVDRLTVRRAYLARSSRALDGTAVSLSSAGVAALADGTTEIASADCSTSGLEALFRAANIEPNAVLSVAFQGRAAGPGVFLFADHRKDGRLVTMTVMLNRAVELITTHLDSIALLGALQAANADLDRRVAERTHDLHEAIADLQQQVQERLKAEAALQASHDEYRRSQEQLRQAQKMEPIGRLAGGIAHDFNNLLTSILGNAALAIDQMVPEDPAFALLNDIRIAGESAASLTRQLLAFSRKQLIEPRLLSLNGVIGNMQRMLQRIIGEDIAFEARLADDLHAVKADPGQLEQILVNLCVNARDAMPGGGRLEVETRDVDLRADDDGRPAEALPGRYVAVSVRDTGVGIPEADRPHIFEPFFTTKAKGTGLGLSMVYGAATQNGGFVTLDSTVGEGTTFTVYLPAADDAIGDSAAPHLRGEGGPASAEVVALIEDDDLVRELVRRVLERKGYTVVAFATGEAALAALGGGAPPVHLLLTDVVLPGINGRELAARLEAVYPALRVLYSSGYTDDVIVRHGILDGGLQFIAKPYTPEALTARVRAALDAR